MRDQITVAPIWVKIVVPLGALLLVVIIFGAALSGGGEPEQAEGGAPTVSAYRREMGKLLDAQADAGKAINDYIDSSLSSSQASIDAFIVLIDRAAEASRALMAPSPPAGASADLVKADAGIDAAMTTYLSGLSDLRAGVQERSRPLMVSASTKTQQASDELGAAAAALR